MKGLNSMKNNIISIIVLVLIWGQFTIHCLSKDFRKSQTQDAILEKDSATREKLKRISRILNEGNSFFQKGNFEKSLEKANLAVNTYPTAPGYYLAGVSEYKLGKNRDALVSLKKGTDIDPENEQILLTLGIIYTAEGKNEDAIEVYGKLESLPVKDKYNYSFKKAVILKNQGKFEQSYETLKRIPAEEFAFPAQLNMQLGDAAVQLKKYEEAEIYFEEARKNNPELLSAKKSASITRVASALENGNQAMRKKNYKEAASHFQTAIQNDPKNPTPYIFLGNARILTGEYEAALKAFESSLALKSDYQEAISGIAAVHYKTGNYRKSVSVLEKSISLFPNNAIYQNQMGLNMKALGEPAKALVYFTRARELDSAFAEPITNLVFLLIAENRYKAARKEAEFLKSESEKKQIISFIDVSEQIYEGDKHLRQGDTKGAKVFYEKAKKASSEEPSVYNAFGRLYFISGDPKSSEENFKKALSINKQNIPALQGLIRLYSSQKNQNLVNQYTKELENLTGNDPSAAIVLGRTYEDKKEYEKAENVYKNLQKKFPNNEAVNFRLAMLYYKISLEENEKNNHDSALNWISKAEKLTKDIPEIAETRKTIQENQKFETVIPIIQKANKFFDTRQYEKAIPLYQEAFQKTGKLTLYIKIAECHLALGNEEKGISMLESPPPGTRNLQTREAINAFLLRKGEIDKAESGFKEILAKKPDSYYSHYQMGIIHLQRKKYEASIDSFDRSLLLNTDFVAARIGKGISMYHSGNKKLAKEGFETAMQQDSANELAPYNIGIILFNDNLYNEAIAIFKEIIQKNPEFSDAHYQISYIYYKRGDLEQAEKEIRKALDLERNEKNLFGLIRILSEQKTKIANPAVKKEILELGRELAEKFPASPHATQAERLVITDEDTPVILQSYQSRGKLIGVPVLINNSVILNYGTSVETLDKNRGIRLWRIQTKTPYKFLLADKRLVGISEKKLEIMDLKTGLILRETILPAGEVKKANLSGENILIEVMSGKSSKIYSYSDQLELNGSIVFEGSFWVGIKSGVLFSVTQKDGIQTQIYDSSLKDLNVKTVSQRGTGELRYLGSHETGIFFLSGKKIVSIDNEKSTSIDLPNDSTSQFVVRSPYLWFRAGKTVYRVESNSLKVSSFTVEASDIEGILPGKKDDGIVLFKSGKAIRYGIDGKPIWSYPLKDDEGKIYSLVYR
ncbi:tetratricopeptide repeat protein [Leptospira borgpetersenii]|uniref:Tetratricopeptide repeat protein n=1 Tax=Leptospira borgpetersenii serovar Javanica str. UI 09931 TaxID=1049767 RepID=A0AAV3JBS8_LEPBO|nr:tetratricopeptide repeat protein [Leptospira borgpetersenii]AXX14287.1 tetratricopeptide repeat protein [Leptospira borgpetersenii serovar Ceylonica]EKQ92211.1 tetratricopeptide repeat protein [Leptospira borgpetersenii str. UI 09149]EMN59457.1 tetratricopeptide repeat protein [Leptospira borgpetersenii serovar Javanica str. MK146]EPG58010.1 tetratricopeptide repeat protein [Leptospira borgpetersenii serovar Javanica str. UI 09931]MDQ7242986.1 tetratricopeptide repeat protein [Leptospira bo